MWFLQTIEGSSRRKQKQASTTNLCMRTVFTNLLDCPNKNGPTEFADLGRIFSEWNQFVWTGIRQKSELTASMSQSRRGQGSHIVPVKSYKTLYETFKSENPFLPRRTGKHVRPVSWPLSCGRSFRIDWDSKSCGKNIPVFKSNVTHQREIS